MYNMHVTGGEGAGYDIVIIGRRDYTSGEYRQIARDWIKQFSRLPFTEEKYKDFSEKIEYYRMDFSDPAAYEGLENYYKERGLSEHIFYFAVAPRFFSTIAEGLDGIHEAGKGKVILEKPFGEDLESAKELSRRLEEIFCAGSDLPYRSLSGKRNGPQYADHPLHQSGFCKQLEQGRGQLHTDFRHGGCGRRKQGRLL